MPLFHSDLVQALNHRTEQKGTVGTVYRHDNKLGSGRREVGLRGEFPTIWLEITNENRRETMIRLMILVLVSVAMLAVADIQMKRLRAAGHISSSAKEVQVVWLAFVLPMLQVLWAGLYEMIRSVARGQRQKPPFGLFLLAWLTGKAQPFRKLIRFREASTVRQIEVTEWVRPPRPSGRPRKYRFSFDQVYKYHVHW